MSITSSLQNRIGKQFPLAYWLIPNRPLLSGRRFVSLIFLKTKRRLHLDYSFYPPAKSTTIIDVFIPTIEKDAAMVGMAIDSIRNHVQHPIGDIYIVAPAKSTALAKIAKHKDCTFVSEEQVLPFNKNEIKYTVDGINRSGWIYKMLLNLYADTICFNRHILILDGDTQFIAPQIFIYKDKPLFNLSDEYHQPYFDANYRLLGIKHKLSRSFITHYMLFDAEVLAEFRAALEEKWTVPWYEAIINIIDTKELSGFADYEVYGDYYVYRSGRPYILNYWSNHSLYFDNFKPGTDYIEQVHAAAKKFSTTHRSVSLHTYKDTLE